MSHRVAVPPLVAVARHCGLERHEFTLLFSLCIPHGTFPSFSTSITLFLISFPCLTHLCIPSCSPSSLQPLFVSACPSLVPQQSFIHTSFCPFGYPHAKVHLDCFPLIPCMPHSLLAPSLPLFLSQLPPFPLFLLLDFASSFFPSLLPLPSSIHNDLFMYPPQKSSLLPVCLQLCLSCLLLLTSIPSYLPIAW